MKKRILPIILAIAAVLAVFAYLVYASFNGSIIQRIAVTSGVRNYIRENYADMPLEVRFCRYDFKMNLYCCTVESAESIDTHFTVYHGQLGYYDDYAHSVMGLENTKLRLSLELDDYVEELTERVFPHKTSLIIGELTDFGNDDGTDGYMLDMPFDINTLPSSVSLTVWCETAYDEPSWDELAERFRELEAAVRSELPGLEYCTLMIQAKYIENDGEYVPESYSSQVCAFDVPVSVIVSDGSALEDYLADVRAAQEEEEKAIAAGIYEKSE